MPYGTVNADKMTTSDGVSSSGLYGFKNRIINGAMVIDQRNAGASVSISSNTYTLDRYRSLASGGGVYSVQQSSTAPAGFVNSMIMTVTTTAASPSAANYYALRQSIEGYNIADLNQGTANAKTFTVSFWVRSSLTGTFGGSVDNDVDRSYPFTYTISTANTFEYKTITVTGSTDGTWVTTNGIGINIQFALGVGSSRAGTAGAWASATYFSATGATNVMATNGATFYITGVQLEKGSTATSFDYRPFGTELQLCQRYYQSINFSEAQGVYTKFGNGVAISTTQARTNTFLLVKMRTYPSLVVTSTASNYGVSVTSDIACSAVPTINSNTNPSIATIESTVASGLTAGNAVIAQANNNQTAYVGFNAEL